MGDVRVERLRAADLDAVLAIEEETPAPWSRAQLASELQRPGGWHYVARRVSDQAVVGYLYGYSVADEAEILKLAVASHYRRQGVAAQLLAHAVGALAGQGGRRVFLELRASNRPARRLYEKTGFREFCRRKGYYAKPPEDAIVMEIKVAEGDCLLKNIRDIAIREKKVLIRVDFNVPLDEQRNITDDTRIRGVLPTINHALDENAKIIICSHMGRPKGQRKEEFSLVPVAKRLSRLIAKEVKLAPDCIGPAVQAMVDAMQPGDVLLLENLRFHAGEQENNEEFARQLADLADVYINDAFAVAHRAHASVVGVTRFSRACGAGFLLQKEMDYFNRSVKNPMRPLVAIVGGAKVSSKLGALRNLMDRVDKMIIGGAMANTFLKSMGHEVGQSKVEDDLLETARELIEKARQQGVKLYLPVDCIVADKFEARAETKRVTTQEVPREWMVLDIGPATATLFTEALEDAKTIIWNGPMGAFEMDAFSRGTMAMVQSLARSHALTIVGGGDTDVAVHQAGESNNISYISTGGGAFLMLMEGKKLPGVEALKQCQ